MRDCTPSAPRWRPAFRELTRQWTAAEAGTPWWAQPGREYLKGDGTWTGAIVGWPAIDDGRVPSHPSYMLKKRFSPRDIKDDFELDLRRRGEGRRSELRSIYRRRMLALTTRLRQQRAEEQKAGLPELEAQLDSLREQIEAIDRSIEQLDVSPLDMPQKVGALILISSNYDRKPSDIFGRFAALDAVRPLLTGLVGTHAEHAATNWDERIDGMPFYSAA